MKFWFKHKEYTLEIICNFCNRILGTYQGKAKTETVIIRCGRCGCKSIFSMVKEK